MISPGDAATREIAGRDLDRCFILDAGAGTGKTTVLISRILEAVRTGKSDLEHIVAITFTEKAAGELKVRLRFELEQALCRCCGEEEGRFRQAAADIERAQVTTIHSFCAALLHERPVEAGVKPDFQVLDQLSADLLFDRVWEEWLAEEMDRRAPALAVTLRNDIKLDALKATAKFLVENRDLLGLLPQPRPSDPGSTVRRVTEGLEQLNQLQSDCKDPTDAAHQQVDLLREILAELSRSVTKEGLTEGLAGLSIRFSNLGNQNNWRSKECLARLREILKELHDEVARFTAVEAHNRAVETVRWLQALVERYERAKKERGSLDFFDLLYRCRNLLKENKQLRGYFQRRFDYILVDEFQDTDPLQIEILFFLAEAAPRADHWNQVRLAAGKLFLVGDPKQSIYSFRRADIEAYHQAKAALSRQGSTLPLSLNFRSRSAVIHWVNNLFAKLIHPPETGTYQPAYQPISPSRAGENDTSVIALPLSPAISVNGARAPDIRVAEARTVAAFLKRIVADGWIVSDPRSHEERPVRFGDTVILFRTKEAIDLYEEEFRDFDIPYRVAGGHRYYSRLEMNSLLALLSCLDNPRDTVALAAALRSPFFGVSDEELFLHVQNGFPLDYSIAGKASDSMKGTKMPESIRAAFLFLDEFHAKRNELGLPVFVLKLFEASRILPLLYLKPQGDQKVANLLKIVDMARSLEARGILTLRAFVRFLKKMDAAEAEEGESPLAEDSENVVRIMSIHKSKGLEFPLVIVGDIAYGGKPRGRQAFLNRADNTLEVRIGAQDKAPATLGWQCGSEQEKLRETAEGLRLLYVSVTRARDYFVLPVGPAGDKEKFLSPLWEDLAPGEDLPWGKEIQCRSGSKIRVYDSRTLNTEKKELRPFRSTIEIKKLLGPPALKTRAAEASLGEYHAWEQRHRDIRVKGRSTKKIVPAGVVVKLADEKPQVSGRGAQFGSFVHELFRAIDFRNPHNLKKVAEALGRVYGLDSLTIEHGIEMLQWGLSSSVIRRAASAQSSWKEVPFVYRRGDDLVEGFIDLVFQEGPELVVVDFKTDALKDTVALDKKHRHYMPQGNLYAMALEAITQKKVKEIVFLFLSAKTERSSKPDRLVLQELQKSLEESLQQEGP